MWLSILGFWFAHVFIFTSILWLITLVGKLFYTNKYFKFKFNFYECGFRSIKFNKIYYDINFIFVILFVIIYDAEFIVFLPFCLNFSGLSPEGIFIFLFFVSLLLITLIVDSTYFALDWQVH